MKTLAATLALLLLGLSPNIAQLALSYTYAPIQKSAWNEAAENIEAAPPFTAFDGLSLGYWFRLKSYRWEFLPEISHERMRKKNQIENYTYHTQSYSLQLHNRIYFFDFLNDCNCPTFSKQNTFFKRGFFFELSPGAGLLQLNYSSPQKKQSYQSNLFFTLSAGVGLDIGLSDRFTLTPIIRYRYQHQIAWSDELSQLAPYAQSSPPPPLSDNWHSTVPTIQLLWRFR